MNGHTILVAKTHALGDLLLVTPALVRVRRACPGARILLLTTEACAPLVRGLEAIDEVVTMRDLTVGSALGVLPRLWRHRITTAVAFQASLGILALARAAGARSVISLRDLPAGVWPPPFDRYTPQVYCELVDRFFPSDTPPDPLPRVWVSHEERRAARALVGEAPYALLAPGGGKNLRQSVPAKRWAPDRFAAVAEWLGRRGLAVVAVGAPWDRPLTHAIRARCRLPLLDLAGATDLRLLAALVGESSLVVTIDSVTLHLAVALDRPLVGLFGPTSAANFLPPGQRHQVAVSSPVACSPCYGNGLFPGCRQGTPVCMDAITVNAVLDALGSIGA